MPYPFVPPEVEKRYGSSRIVMPNEYCDPARSPPTSTTATSTSTVRRRPRPRHHAQRAPPDDDLPRLRRAAHAPRILARQTTKAKIAISARRSCTATTRSVSPKRSPCWTASRAAASSPASCAASAPRFTRQHQPGAAARAHRRGARPDRQGLDDARAVQLGRSLLALPLRQRLAARLPAAASADLDHAARTPDNVPMGGRPPVHLRHVPDCRTSGRRAWSPRTAVAAPSGASTSRPRTVSPTSRCASPAETDAQRRVEGGKQLLWYLQRERHP